MQNAALVALVATLAALACAHNPVPSLPLCGLDGSMELSSIYTPPAEDIDPPSFPTMHALTPYVTLVTYLRGFNSISLPTELVADLVWTDNTTAPAADAATGRIESLLPAPVKLGDSLFLAASVVLSPHRVLVVFRESGTDLGIFLGISVAYTVNPTDPAARPLLASITVVPPLVLFDRVTSGGPAASFFGRIGSLAPLTSTRALAVISLQPPPGFTTVIDEAIVVVEFDGSTVANVTVPEPMAAFNKILAYYAPSIFRLGDPSNGVWALPITGPPVFLLVYADLVSGMSGDLGIAGVIVDATNIYAITYTPRVFFESTGEVGRVDVVMTSDSRFIIVAHAISTTLDISASACSYTIGPNAIFGCSTGTPLSPTKTEVIVARSIGPHSAVISASSTTTSRGFVVVAAVDSNPSNNTVFLRPAPPGYTKQFSALPPTADLSTANQFLQAFVVPSLPHTGLYPDSYQFVGIQAGTRSLVLAPYPLVFPAIGAPPPPLAVTFLGATTAEITVLSGGARIAACLELPPELEDMEYVFVPSATGGQLQFAPTASGPHTLRVHTLAPPSVIDISLDVAGIPASMLPPGYNPDGVVLPHSIPVAWAAVSNADSLGTESVTYILSAIFADPVTGDLPVVLNAANATVVHSGLGLSANVTGLSPGELVALSVEAVTTVGGMGSGPSAFSKLRSRVVCTAPGSFLPSFSPIHGPCVFCSAGDYIDTDARTGLRSCAKCAPKATAPEAADSRDQCVCIPGFYAPNAAAPADCVTCPPGAFCAGAARPTPLDGYFDVGGDGSKIVACPRPASCVAPGACATGYAGLLCAVCADGYYADVATQECLPCPTGSGGLLAAATIASIVAVIVAFCLLVRLTVYPWESAKIMGASASRIRAVPHSISVGVVFLQILGVLRNVQTKWPSSVSRTLGAFQVLNFDLNLVASECSISSFESLYVISAVLPLIGVCIHTLGFVVAWYAPWTSTYLRTTRGGASVGLGHMLALATERLVCVGGTVLYIGMAQSALVYYDCTRSPANGKYYLDASPDTECFDSAWWTMFPLAFSTTLLYVVGLPAYLALILRAKVRGNVTDPATLARYGSIFALYRRPLYYYEVVHLGKRLAIVFAALFISSVVVLQIGVLLVIFQLFTLMTVRMHPYYRRLYNSMELRLNVAISFILVAAIVFHVDRFPNEFSRIVFIIAAFVVIAVCIFFIFSAAYTEFASLYRRRRGGGSGAATPASGAETAVAAGAGPLALNERESIFFTALEREFDDITHVNMKLQLLDLYNKYVPEPKDLDGR